MEGRKRETEREMNIKSVYKNFKKFKYNKCKERRTHGRERISRKERGMR